MKKRPTSDELDAALRAEPDYQELCRLLDNQTDTQKARFAFEMRQRERMSAMSTKEELNARLKELLETGISHATLAARLNEEGYRNDRGKEFTKESIRKRAKGLTSNPQSQPSQGGADKTAEQPAWEGSEPCEAKEPSPDTANLAEDASLSTGERCEESQLELSPEVIAALRKIAREEIDSMRIANTANNAEVPPPYPKIEGKKREGAKKGHMNKLAGKKENLPGTRVDLVLWNMFEKDREDRNISASALMQEILWRHYGKPPLSFQGREE